MLKNRKFIKKFCNNDQNKFLKYKTFCLKYEQ